MIAEDATNQEQIEIELPNINFNIKDIKWQQQGYHLIGLSTNGLKFGIKIDSKLRLIGVDKENKPIFKRIDI
jgi:hypothetical protein